MEIKYTLSKDRLDIITPHGCTLSSLAAIRKELNRLGDEKLMWERAAGGWHDFYDDLYCAFPDLKKSYGLKIEDWPKD